MKRRFALFGLVLLMVFSLLGCKKTEPAPTPTPEPPVVVDPVLPPVEEPGSVPDLGLKYTEASVSSAYGVDGNAATAENKAILTINLKAPKPDDMPAIADFYQSWLDDQAYTLSTTYLAEAQQRAEEQTPDIEPVVFTFEAGYAVTRNDKNVFSVLRDFYISTGTPKPLISTLCENFRPSDGALLVLSDIFLSESDAYMAKLGELIVPIAKKNEADAGQPFYFEDFWSDPMAYFEPSDFCLTADGLTLLFQTYAIAPDAAGTIRFDIPYAALDDILNPDYKITQ